VVVSTYRLFIPNDFHNRWLKQPALDGCALSGLRAPRARLRPLRNEAISLWRSHPSFAKEGNPVLFNDERRFRA
jgi:hypothetical protein